MWSFRGNACDIPTDCPTRERAGWTGDWQLYVPTATFLYDVAGFSAKWLRDLAAGQWDNGDRRQHGADAARPSGPASSSTSTARRAGATPSCWCRGRSTRSTATCGCSRSCGRRWWPGSTSSSARAAGAAAPRPGRGTPGPRPARASTSGTPASTGASGWCPARTSPTSPAFIAADKTDVATAFFARSTRRRRADRAAARPGRRGRALRGALSDAVVDAWRTEFLAPTGESARDTQANLVRALRFGLVPGRAAPAQPPTTWPRWSARTAPTSATGFLATPDLLPVLADGGHLDTAYDLLFQDTAPSWMTMIDRGATTVWERWEGIDEDGVPHESLNHYSKGAVIGFLHRYVAGLRAAEPDLAPLPGPARPGGGHHLGPGRARVAARPGRRGVAGDRRRGAARRGDRAAGLHRRGGAAVGRDPGGRAGHLALDVPRVGMSPEVAASAAARRTSDATRTRRAEREPRVAGTRHPFSRGDLRA